MPVFHERFKRLTRERLRAYAKKQKCTPDQLAKLESAVDDDSALDDAVKKAKAGTAVKAIGDGSILQAIKDFLSSPQGQAFIKVLFSLLMGLLGETPPAAAKKETSKSDE